MLFKSNIKIYFNNMKNLICLNKPTGLTPLQAILEFKKQNPLYLNEKISYAGRLDPMAEGLLILLINEENKNRELFENLQKTYEFTILLGIETDTYDILGKIINCTQFEIRNLKLEIENMFSSFLGKHIQPYPPYSSKAVQGKPLYWWSRNGRLSEIEIPQKEIEIFKLELLSHENIKINDIRFMIQDRIKKVQGDFRQDEILKTWNNFFNSTSITTFQIIKCKIECSSGTYIRSFAREIGLKLKTGAIALEIKRLKVGEYKLEDALRI